MTQATVMAERSDDWRLKHLATIGGSNAAAVVGRARFKTPAKLWQQMRVVIETGQPPPPIPPTDDMNRGAVLEPIAIDQLARKLGVRIDPHDQDEFLYSGELPWAHSLPDGWCADDIVEVKCPRPATVMRCNLEGLLAEWEIQAQHNMAVCGRHRTVLRCHVGLFDAMSVTTHHFCIQRDDVFIGQIMAQEQAFFESVATNKPPPDEIADAVEPEFDPHDRAYWDAPEAAELLRTWFRLKAIETDLTESLATAKARIQEKMTADAATVAEIPRLARVFWKMSKAAKRLDKDAVLAKYPEAATDESLWKMSKPSRPFRVYALGD